MIWPAAAIPGAALRVTRTAVGRRVLQLALLVGGLFAAGLLCGGQAQAADGVPGKPVSLGGPGVPVVASVVKPTPVSAPAPAPVLAPVVASVSDIVERVVRPVSDVVTKTLTEVLAEAPSLPTVPTLPSVPVVPSQPVPPVRVPPVRTVPVSAPVRSAPQSSSDGRRSPTEPAEVAAGVGATYGPRFVAAADKPGAVGRAAVRHAASGGHAPAHQSPNGDPDGAPRDQQAVDGGGSRHCDAQAVTLGNRVAVRFVPGVAEGADAAETRDRYRDVPVFPG